MNVPPLHFPGTGPSLAEEGVELFQNSPNPFIEMTQLRFRLSGATEVVVRLFDAKGQEVTTKKGNYAPGEHHLVLHRADLREAGLHTCRLETLFGTVSRKLMMY